MPPRPAMLSSRRRRLKSHAEQVERGGIFLISVNLVLAQYYPSVTSMCLLNKERGLRLTGDLSFISVLRRF